MQPIHETIDKEFEGFVNDNGYLTSSMRYGAIVDISKVGLGQLLSTHIREYPYNVKYMGVYNHQGKPVYVFLDREFKTIYKYHAPYTKDC